MEIPTDFTDFTIVANDGKIGVHKIILSMNSDYFKTMLKSTFVEATSALLRKEEYTLEDIKTALRVVYFQDDAISQFVTSANWLSTFMLLDEWMVEEKLMKCMLNTVRDLDLTYSKSWIHHMITYYSQHPVFKPWWTKYVVKYFSILKDQHLVDETFVRGFDTQDLIQVAKMPKSTNLIFYLLRQMIKYDMKDEFYNLLTTATKSISREMYGTMDWIYNNEFIHTYNEFVDSVIFQPVQKHYECLKSLHLIGFRMIEEMYLNNYEIPTDFQTWVMDITHEMTLGCLLKKLEWGFNKQEVSRVISTKQQPQDIVFTVELEVVDDLRDSSRILCDGLYSTFTLQIDSDNRTCTFVHSTLEPL
jgi:hypothetical protein